MNTKPSIQIYSFFSGCGFLDLGFEATDYQIAFANEIYDPFLKAHAHSRNQLKLQHPIYGYSAESIIRFLDSKNSEFLKDRVAASQKGGNLVGFIGGPPCPDFSIAGKNKGGEGEKGKLSEAYIDLICQQHPDFFLFENVKGLWRTKKHREFYEHIKQKAISSGYFITERLINSIEYGVPQDRERIILIGFKERLINDLKKSVNYQTGELSKGSFPWTRYSKYVKEQVLGLEWPTISPFEKDSVLSCPNSLPQELTIEHWFRQNNVQEHPNAEHHFQPRAALPKFESIDEGDVSKKSFKRLHRWRYSPTAAYGNNEVHVHPYKARRISASEALAIQSLPKEFSLPPDISLSAMFKTIGNGVPYLAAKAIAQSITDYIEDVDQITENDRLISYDQKFATQPFLPLRESSDENKYRVS